MEKRISMLEEKLNAMMKMQKKIAIKNGDIPFKIVVKSSRPVSESDLDPENDQSSIEKTIGIGLTLTERNLNLVSNYCFADLSREKQGWITFSAKNYFTGSKAYFCVGTCCLLFNSIIEYKRLDFNSIIPYKDYSNVDEYLDKYDNICIYDMDDNYICKLSEVTE